MRPGIIITNTFQAQMHHNFAKYSIDKLTKWNNHDFVEVNPIKMLFFQNFLLFLFFLDIHAKNEKIYKF